MIDNTKAKSQSISAIMKSPNLLSSLQDALNAPVGSTKRNKAKSILKTIGRANNVQPEMNIMDGQGGSGDLSTLGSSYGMNQDSQFSGMNFSGVENLPKDVTFNPSTGQMEPVKPASQMTYQGQPIPQEQVDMGSSTLSSKLLFLPDAPKPATETKVNEYDVFKIMDYVKQNPDWMPSYIKDMLNKTGTKAGGGLSVQQQQQVFGKAEEIVGSVSPEIFKIAQRYINEFEAKHPTTVPSTKTGEKKTQTPISITTDERNSMIQNYINAGYSQADAVKRVDELIATRPDSQKVIGTTPNVTLPQTTTTPEPTAEDISSFINDYAKDPMSAVVNAVNQGIGASTFAYSMLADKQKLLDMGFPQDIVDSLGGASISRQVDALSNTLKSEYNLDSQLENILEMKKTGASIIPNLQDYVKGRDTYVKQLDSMIDDATDKMHSIDMTDPTVSGLMTNYKNYLTILKGRHNKRYVDFINTSVDLYEDQINSSIDTYNASKELYLEEFKSKSAIKIEDYNILKTGLEEMYNNVASAEAGQLDKAILEQQYYQEVYKTAELAAKASGDSDSTKGYFTNRSYYDNLLKNSQEEVDKDTVMTNVDLGSLMQQAANDGYNSGDVLTPLTKEIKDNSKMVTNNLDKYIDNYSNMIQDYYRTYSTDPETGEVYQTVIQNAIDLSDTLLQQAKQQLTQHLDSDPGFAQDIKSAIRDLVGPKGWPVKVPANANDIVERKDEWMKKHKDLPKTILNSIYDLVTKGVPLGNFSNPMDIFTTVFQDNGLGSVDQVELGDLDKLDNSQLMQSIYSGMKIQFNNII